MLDNALTDKNIFGRLTEKSMFTDGRSGTLNRYAKLDISADKNKLKASVLRK